MPMIQVKGCGKVRTKHTKVLVFLSIHSPMKPTSQLLFEFLLMLRTVARCRVYISVNQHGTLKGPRL